MKRFKTWWNENSMVYRSLSERFDFWLFAWAALVSSALQMVSFCYLHLDPVLNAILNRISTKHHLRERAESDL